MPRKITNDDLSANLNKLSLPDFLTLIDRYADANSVDMEKVKLELVQKDIQKLVLEGGTEQKLY